MLEVRRARVLVLILTLALGMFPYLSARGAGECNASVSPTVISPGNESTLQFDIQNTSGAPAVWVRVQRPSASYSVNGITQSGWTDATDDNGTTLTDSSLASGDTVSLQLAMFTAPQEEAPAAWTVQIAPNSDGSGAVSCSGSLETEIGTPPTPPSPNGESNIGLAHITATTATITWTSDAASTSYVYYGTTTSYGKLATAPGSTIDHTVTLTGLSPNTIYHYMVAGTSDQGDNFFSDDNTFITPEAPPAIPPTSSSPVTVSGGTKIVVPATPGDTTAPTITLDTSIKNPYKTAPNLTGTATDNAAIAAVEYSIDGGLNWLPVTKLTGLGAKRATFSFTPLLQEDGNYAVALRALDGNANQTRTTSITLVIDRLPPQAGPIALTHGLEAITPDEHDVVNLLAGADYKLLLSAVGGPVTFSLEAEPIEQLGAKKTFTLTQSSDLGLWSGALSFATSGIYRLTAYGVDGAGNRTTRAVLTATVVPAGRVVAAGGTSGISGAKLTLHYLEPTTGTWHVWDGAPYNQLNPQYTKADGSYSLLVPKGKYYLQVTAPDHRGFTSNIFTVTDNLSLASVIPLAAAPQVSLGSLKFSLPDWGWQSQPLPPPANKPIAGGAAPSLLGTQIPAFRLPTTTDGAKRNIDYEGRPTVFSIVTTWSPSSQAQLGPLAAVQSNRDVNVVPVFSQEHETMVGVYLSTAGTNLTGLVDPDGILVPGLQVSAVPQHIFVDRSGRIKKVMLGVLSKDQLLDQLGRL